jgi:hypothetical protein
VNRYRVAVFGCRRIWSRNEGLKNRIRSTKLDAIPDVFVNPNSRDFNAVQEAFRSRNSPEVFRICAAVIGRFAQSIERFSDQVSKNAPPDFAFVHGELVNAWTNLTVIGQYVSAVFLSIGRFGRDSG